MKCQIDKIVRLNYHEYIIIFTHRTPVKIESSGDAYALLKYFLGTDGVMGRRLQ